MNISLNREKLRTALLDDESRLYIQQLMVYILLAVLCASLTILNIIAKNTNVVWVTAIYTGLCVINICLHFINMKTRKFAIFAFAIESLVLFTCLIIVGGPGGFSPLWVLTLPTYGLFLYKKKYGTIWVLTEFVVIVFLLWTPIGRSLLQYEYSKDFIIRYPILYIALFAITFFFEVVRSNTYKEMINGKNKYEYLYLHDALTDVYNRYGFYKKIEELFNEDDVNRGLAIFDLDLFKSINDTYGHEKGDIVLKTLVKTARNAVKDDAFICRWGGDEFIAIFKKAFNAKELANKVLEDVRNCEFDFNGKKVKISISMGLVIGNDKKIDITEITKQADRNLYVAKENGRNCIVDSFYEEIIS